MEEEFKVTDEELEKFGSAMKKQEFRDLLVDYVKEIQDPENKKRYEEEIVELERRRGHNVKFINPKPGFVLKIYLEPGRRKIYVNICTSEVVAEATSTPAQGVGSKKKSGADWSVPYTFTSPRDDLDKSGKRCKVYDCVFHPNTYKKGEKYLRFKQLLVETAVGAVEKREGGRASPDRVKILSMAYKGVVQPAIFRDSTEKKEEEKRDGESDRPFGVTYPPLPKTSKKKKTSQQKTKTSSSSSPSEPVYTVKYRGEVAMGDFTNERVSQVVRRPNEIVVTIELPGLTSAGTVVLDVTEKQLILDNKDPAFHLDLALSYPVAGDSGRAEFDKIRQCLTVTLPILPDSTPHTLTPSPLAQPTNQTAESGSHDPEDQPTNQVAESGSHDPEDQPTNQIAELESCDPEDQPTNQTAESGSHDPEDQPTNQIAKLESCDPEDQPTNQTAESVSQDPEDQPTNQIAESEDEAPPTVMKSGSEMTSSTNQNAGAGHVTWTSRGNWVAPSFTYRQDNERVVFVLHSSHIKPSTLVHHHDNHQFQVMYSCVDKNDATQTINCSLLVCFRDDDLVESTSVDISEENMVVVVTKAANNQREWAWFEAGINAQSTERKLFLTEENVVSGVKEMRESDPWGCGSNLSEVKVSSSEHEVELEMKKVQRSEDEEERNGDAVVRNRDNSKNEPATAVWNGDTSGDSSSSHTGIERGRGTDLHLTNNLLFDLD